MSPLEEGEELFATFRKNAESGKVAAAKTALARLKILMISFESLPPQGIDSPIALRERTLARDVIEIAVFLSAQEGDRASFQRHMAQARERSLKPYYLDFASELPATANQNAVQGLNLLFLLVENRLAEFHSELELLSDNERAHECVSFPVRLEQYLMVGSYDQVLAARDHVPHQYYKYFLESLVDTVREGIAECSEVAYTELPLADARQMMLLAEGRDFEDYVEERHPDWVISGDKVVFQKEEVTLKSSEIKSMRLIAECLSYATELERIV
ncbi:unnamed protein product [Choristocarpus tenellus]